MSAVTIRRFLRYIHITGSMALGTYIYSPLGNDPAFQDLIKFGVIPLLGLTGIWMWKQATIARKLKRSAV